MKRAWAHEILLLFGLIAGISLVFSMFNLALWGAFLGLLIFSAHHLRQLYRMERWLRVGRLRNPPESSGVWGVVFEQYLRWQRRYYSRKKKLGKVIREFRDSTAAMPDGTLVLDRDFCIVWFNEAAEKMLRLSSQRDLGQSILNLVRTPVFRTYLQSKSYDSPIQFPSPQFDDVILSVRMVPYGSEQYLLLVRDVTRIQRLQKMRREFVANASHELRSPLTVISGYLDALPEIEELPADWQQPIEEMQFQCRRMSSLIEDLLELSRLETELPDDSARTEVFIPELVERVVSATLREDAHGHDINFICEAPASVVGVYRELYSAVSNLVSNAVRYSPEGSPVRIIWSIRDDGDGVLSVEDRGIGISEKHLPFVTQRFYRVDSARTKDGGGTGLGLAIVKHVLQRHDSRLEIDSKLGEGTTFRCILPKARINVAQSKDDQIASASST